VTSMSNERDAPQPRERPTDAAVSPGADEPEPDWAEEIRARRRARGDRLREIFATFDEAPARGEQAPQDREEPRT